jgi:hypothetical protein
MIWGSLTFEPGVGIFQSSSLFYLFAFILFDIFEKEIVANVKENMLDEG